MNEKIEKVKVPHVSSDMHLKTRVANQAAMTVERERKEVLQLEADIERLKVTETVCLPTLHGGGVQNENFHNVQSLVNYLDSLFYLKDRYVDTMGKAQEAVLLAHPI